MNFIAQYEKKITMHLKTEVCLVFDYSNELNSLKVFP